MASLKDLLVTGPARIVGKVFSTGGFSGPGSELTSLNGSNISSGTVPYARLPVGTGSSQVAQGSHTHSYLPLSGGTLTDMITFNKTGDTALIKNTYENSTYNLIRSHNEGNISVSASSGGLYLGYDHTRIIDFLCGKASLDSSGNFNAKGTIKQNGTAVSLSTHTHTLSLATSTGTNSITLAASTKYQLTAGGSTYIFTTPPNTTYSNMSADELTTGTVTTGRLISAKTINDNFGTLLDKACKTRAEEYDIGALWYDDNGDNVKSGILPISYGGTGAQTAAAARTNLGITPANIGAATSGHTHTISLAADSGTSSITLASASKYKLTAGGSSIIFTMPTIPAAYTHPTTEGNKHIPSGGSSGQFLGWDSSGTAKWVANPNTNTWRGIQDNLTSSSNTTESLSAKQGYLLANGSARDSTKLPLTGGTMTGRLTTTKPINQIITGSGTAASDGGASASPNRYKPAKWTFNTGMTVTDGDIITIKIPVAGHTYGVYVSIDNGVTYKPVVLNGTGRITTHYPVNTYLTLIYEASGSAADMFALNGADARATVTGGVWRVINYYDSNSDTIPQCYCGTAAATAAKAGSMTYFTAMAKSYVMVTFRYANSSATALTLNINSTGAKPIYINGSASSTSNYTLPAGSYLVYYNGTNYYFRTDGKLTADITGNAATASSVAWENVTGKPSSFTPASHTHTLSLASSTGTSAITLAASTKYQLTAGGSTYIFTTPPNTTYSNMSATELTAGTATAARLISAKTINDNFITLMDTAITRKAEEIEDIGALWYDDPNDTIKLGRLPVVCGGTGAADPAAARRNLYITPENIGAAAADHTHAATVALKSGSATDVPNSTKTALCSNSFSAGTWVFFGAAKFARNTSGTRVIMIATTDNPSTMLGLVGGAAYTPATVETIIRTERILTLTETTTVYVVVSQNSGETLSAAGRLEAFKIG